MGYLFSIGIYFLDTRCTPKSRKPVGIYFPKHFASQKGNHNSKTRETQKIIKASCYQVLVINQNRPIIVDEVNQSQ